MTTSPHEPRSGEASGLTDRVRDEADNAREHIARLRTDISAAVDARRGGAATSVDEASTALASLREDLQRDIDTLLTRAPSRQDVTGRAGRIGAGLVAVAGGVTTVVLLARRRTEHRRHEAALREQAEAVAAAIRRLDDPEGDDDPGSRSGIVAAAATAAVVAAAAVATWQRRRVSTAGPDDPVPTPSDDGDDGVGPDDPSRTT